MNFWKDLLASLGAYNKAGRNVDWFGVAAVGIGAVVVLYWLLG